MTSGSSYDEFNVSPAQEKAFKELLKTARLNCGWSQQQAAANTGVAQTVISSMERGPYPGMRLWDIWRLCDAYGIRVSDVRQTLGWFSDRDTENVNNLEDPRLTLAFAAIRGLDEENKNSILYMIERFVAGVRAKEA